MSLLKLSVLGNPQLERESTPIELETRKALALLVYLAVTRQTHSRDTLATLFWPENDQSQGRTYLRRALWLLKQAVGEEVLLVERQYIGVHLTNLWVDVVQFQDLLTECEQHSHARETVCEDCLRALGRVADLYNGDFLAGFTLPDCPQFDDWQFFEAENLRQQLASVLERLVRGNNARNQHELAIPYARHWVSLDPLHEPAQRALMQVYALAGQQTAALRQYEICVRLLDEELGVTPEPETRKLYEAIKANRLVAPSVKKIGPEPVEVVQPLPTEALPGFLIENSTSETPHVFVARERELSNLNAALDSAQAGQGQILFLIGGAGRGKSLLAQEFSRRAQAEHDDLLVVTGYCDAMTGVSDPYLPFRGALAMLTGDVEAKRAGGLISGTHARRLWEAMPLTLPAFIQHAPDLIGNFVPATSMRTRAATFAQPDTSWFTLLDHLTTTQHHAALEQQRIFSQYTTLLKAIATDRPILFIIEDLHWVDTASSGLLFHLSREIGDSHILILGTYRPEEVPLNWSDARHPLSSLVSELKRQHGDIWLDLDDLVATEGRQFVDAYLDTQPNHLDEAFRDALFRHTGGYALFTVELVQDMQDRGGLVQDENGSWVLPGTIDWQTLPAKVEGVIEKRIQRLEKELQEMLTIASVEGEIFTAEVIARIQSLDERSLVQQLSRELDKRHRLVTAQTLERIGQQRLSRYRFRHHLFQHYLYYSLDELERGYLHEAIGNVLETLYEERMEDAAVQLAWHFQEAGLVEKAITYLRQAREVAARVYAHTEAISTCRQALSLIKEHNVGLEHLSHLYTCLGRSLELNAQFDEAMAVYEEMSQMARQQENRPMELAAQMARVTLYVTPTPIHDPMKGPALGQETLALARELGDQAAEAKTLWNLALSGMWSGHTQEGVSYAEQAVALARQLNLKELLAYALNDLGMLYAAVLNIEKAKPTLYEAGELLREMDNLPMLTDNLSMTAMALVAAGEYEQAIAFSEEAFEMSEASNNLWGQSYSRMMVCLAYWEFGQPDRALAMAEESVNLGKMAGFIASQVLAGGHQAMMYGYLGALEVGMEKARQALSIAEAQFPHFRCHPLGVLAQLHLMAGNLREAEALVRQGKNDPYREAHPNWNMRIHIAEAELALKQGAHEQVITVTDHWLPILRENHLNAYTPTMLFIKGQAQVALNRTETALKCFLEARSIAEAIGARTTLWPVLVILSQLETEPTDALAFHNQAREIVKSIAHHTNSPILRTSFLNLPQVQDLLA